tara:strand:- start:110 stop:1174 length:1065 start_codon:yes stop_codon:yes gene_type:complete
MNHAFTILLLAILLLITGCQAEPGEQQTATTSKTVETYDSTASKFTDSQQDEKLKAAKIRKIREFRFIYAGSISELIPNTEVSIWLPVATDTHEQQILNREINVPGQYVIGKEENFGNTILHFSATANKEGEVPFEIVYHISRKESLRDEEEELVEVEAELFKTGTSFVPTDKKLSVDVLGGIKLAEHTLTAGRQIYDAVNKRMRYDKPEGKAWGRGDSVWACGNGFGNCTDFHSLFISVCREQQIPARFEIGFPIPPQHGSGAVNGYHCWAKFAADNKWIPVDISEADKDPTLTDYYYGNLTANRITFTTGRDLTLNPAQQNGPVNFLVYPYVEVGGKVHTTFRKHFQYEDVH